MDLLYTRCAVSNRTPLAPFRFVLTPNYKTIIHKNPKTPTKAIKELQFDIRDKLPLTYLFDGNSREKTEFLGIITIKYFFESKDDDTHKFRIWVLFVFKNNNKKNNYDLLNLYSGITEEVFICNYRLRQINIPALFEKHTMTHHELLYIIKLSTEKKAFLYKPLGEFEDENIFFLSYRPDLEHTIKDLQMQKIDIKLDRPLEEYFKYIKTIVHITYPIEIMSRSQSNLLTGGSNADINHTVNIITIINERNLYFSKLILSRYYDEFNKIALQLDNMLYYSNTNKEHNYFSNKRKYFYKYLIINYPYLLINKEDAVAKFENIEILNDYKLAMIIKYMQLSFGYGYYTLNEIFIKLD